MSNLPKVLIAEDNIMWQNRFAGMLRGKVEALTAQTIAQAESIIEKQGDQLGAVALDGRIHSDFSCDTYPLAEKLRKKFPNLPIISIATMPDDEKELVEAGCNYSCTKNDLPSKLCEILNLA